MDRDSAQGWLDRYVAAWRSYDADEIGALFTDDVVYRYHPNDEPTVGRTAVVASWLDDGDTPGASSRDAPDTYDARYTPVAIDGDVVVATGTTTYRETPDGPVVHTFDNCFVIRFDGDRCADLVEYYVRRRDADSSE
jgi:ketosteroid isomerase-like protein